jgi:hypothetical protein
MPAERAGSSPGGQGKAVPVEETAGQLSLPIATAENPKDVMSSPSDQTCRDLLSSSAERVRAGVQTVELEEAPCEHRNGT